MEKSMKYVGSDGELPADVEIEEKYVSLLLVNRWFWKKELGNNGVFYIRTGIFS